MSTWRDVDDEIAVIHDIEDLLEWLKKQQAKYRHVEQECIAFKLPKEEIYCRGRADAMQDSLKIIAPFVAKLGRRVNKRTGLEECVI
jgi:hypothetical protein